MKSIPRSEWVCAHDFFGENYIFFEQNFHCCLFFFSRCSSLHFQEYSKFKNWIRNRLVMVIRVYTTLVREMEERYSNIMYAKTWCDRNILLKPEHASRRCESKYICGNAWTFWLSHSVIKPLKIQIYTTLLIFGFVQIIENIFCSQIQMTNNVMLVSIIQLLYRMRLFKGKNTIRIYSRSNKPINIFSLKFTGFSSFYK